MPPFSSGVGLSRKRKTKSKVFDSMALFRPRPGAGVHQALASLQEAPDWFVLGLWSVPRSLMVTLALCQCWGGVWVALWILGRLRGGGNLPGKLWQEGGALGPLQVV